MMSMSATRLSTRNGVTIGCPDDQRHVHDGVVEPGMVEPRVVLGHDLAVVTEDDDHALIENSEIGEMTEEPAELVIEVHDFRVVQIGDVVEVGDSVEVVVEITLEQRDTTAASRGGPSRPDRPSDRDSHV